MVVVVLCAPNTGVGIVCSMAYRLDKESVKTPIHSCAANVVRAVCMDTCSAHMMVRVSSVPAASI